MGIEVTKPWETQKYDRPWDKSPIRWTWKFWDTNLWRKRTHVLFVGMGWITVLASHTISHTISFIWMPLFLLCFNISSSQSVGVIPHVCGKKTSGTKRPNDVLWVLVAATFFPFRSFSLGNSSRFQTAGIIWPETRNHRPKSSDLITMVSRNITSSSYTGPIFRFTLW